MADSKLDAAGGAVPGLIAGAMAFGPLGALALGAIGGVIGGKNIVKGIMGAIEKQSGEFSRDGRIDSERRAKFSDMHDRSREWRESHRDW